jgi:amidase
MPTDAIEVGPEHPIYSFNRAHLPRARIAPGDRVRFTTTDEPYQDLTGEALDSGGVSLRRLNALVGPVFMEGAEPGDALVVTIEEIGLGSRAFSPYVARWRTRTFGVPRSSVEQYRIRDGYVELGDGARIAVRPMVGCAGTAPAEGDLSSLSPTGPTGGNMDLVELTAGTALWLPIQVPGALFALGDLHAAMGRGEPTGAGLECAGTVLARFELARNRTLSGPRVDTGAIIAFVGTDPDETDRAIAAAVGAAWTWLTVGRGVEARRALTLCSALLDVNLGGPAGANAVASFEWTRLAAAGVQFE